MHGILCYTSKKLRNVHEMSVGIYCQIYTYFIAGNEPFHANKKLKSPTVPLTTQATSHNYMVHLYQDVASLSRISYVMINNGVKWGYKHTPILSTCKCVSAVELLVPALQHNEILSLNMSPNDICTYYPQICIGCQ